MAMDMISGRNGGYPCIVQLPELSSVPDSASPYPEHILRTAGKNGGYPSLLKLPELSKVTESAPPYPEYLMRCLGSSVNDGYPCIRKIPGTVAVNLYIQPAKPLIHIYSSRETDFDSNGFAVIMPISGTVRQEKNGMYDVEMEIEADKVSDYVQGNALLKIPIRYHDEIKYQIFRIYYINPRMDSDGNTSIIINARHIFYDLNDKFLTDCRPTGKNGKDAIEWIFNGIYGGITANDLKFSYYSDIQRISTAYYINKSVVGALIGEDNSIANQWGGSLYRDNLYFSINKEMEYCRKTGSVRYASNMLEIDFSVDYSECITFLIAEDNFGNKTQVINPDVPSEQFPHHIYGYVKINYDTENKDQFLEDARAYAENYMNGAVNIKVKFARIIGKEMYKEFLQFEDFEVGDRTIVYHSDLGINYSNLEVIAKEYDIANDEPISIEIGTFKNAICRTGFMSNTVSSGATAADKQLAAVQAELQNVKLKTLRTWDSASASTWDEMSAFTWEEVANIGN